MHAASQRPPPRAHPRAQRNLPGRTCPRISLHRADLKSCQLCSAWGAELATLQSGSVERAQMAQVLAGLGWDSCLPRRWPPSRSNRPERHHLQPHQIQACPDGQKGSCGRHHCLDHGRGSRYLNPRVPGGKLKFRPGLEPTLNETGRELHMCWIASTLSCWKGPVFSAAQVVTSRMRITKTIL